MRNSKTVSIGQRTHRFTRLSIANFAQVRDRGAGQGGFTGTRVSRWFCLFSQLGALGSSGGIKASQSARRELWFFLLFASVAAMLKQTGLVASCRLRADMLTTQCKKD